MGLVRETYRLARICGAFRARVQLCWRSGRGGSVMWTAAGRSRLLGGGELASRSWRCNYRWDLEAKGLEDVERVKDTVRIGMRAEAVRREEREGDIQDSGHFRPVA